MGFFQRAGLALLLAVGLFEHRRVSTSIRSGVIAAALMTTNGARLSAALDRLAACAPPVPCRTGRTDDEECGYWPWRPARWSGAADIMQGRATGQDVLPRRELLELLHLALQAQFPAPASPPDSAGRT